MKTVCNYNIAIIVATFVTLHTVQGLPMPQNPLSLDSLTGALDQVLNGVLGRPPLTNTADGSDGAENNGGSQGGSHLQNLLNGIVGGRIVNGLQSFNEYPSTNVATTISETL